MYSAGADNRCIDNLSSGKFSSQDFDRIYESIIPFVTGGFKALAKASISLACARRRGISHISGSDWFDPWTLGAGPQGAKK